MLICNDIPLLRKEFSRVHPIIRVYSCRDSMKVLDSKVDIAYQI